MHHQIFFMGLDETVFGAVKSSLLSRDPLLYVDEAYQVVTKDEESKRAGHLIEERHDGACFYVQTTQHIRTLPEVKDPIEQNRYLAKPVCNRFSDSTRYHRLVGRLIYLAVTHPDLSYVIHELFHFMSDRFY